MQVKPNGAQKWGFPVIPAEELHHTMGISWNNSSFCNSFPPALLPGLKGCQMGMIRMMYHLLSKVVGVISLPQVDRENTRKSEYSTQRNDGIPWVSAPEDMDSTSPFFSVITAHQPPQPETSLSMSSIKIKPGKTTAPPSIHKVIY